LTMRNHRRMGPWLQRIEELAEIEISSEERAAALEFCGKNRVALFIVAYNAEEHLESVIRRIPSEIRELLSEIVIIDDSSSDDTWEVADRLASEDGRIRAFRTPFNRGYGGNQKLGYRYCIDRGFDWVVLLHGDGQYAPEFLPRVLAAAGEGTDAVLASRMLKPRWALAGGMPRHKWIANKILTGLGNRILRTDFSEFHTGYRAYRIGALQEIPFEANSDDFHFDGQIIAQGCLAAWKFREVAIPTHYGDEICHVPGARYAWQFLRSLMLSRLVRMGIFYKPNYDIALFEEDSYTFKQSPYSLHQWLLRNMPSGDIERSIELGAGSGRFSGRLADLIPCHVAADTMKPERAGKSIAVAVDLETALAPELPEGPYDLCLALDAIEHRLSPEGFTREVFHILRPGGTLIAATANVAYFPVRLSLLFGGFNYGKRGILDMTHRRLFTISSFVRLLRHSGFRIEEIIAFPPPFSDMISDTGLMRLFERFHGILSRVWKNLFAFNFAVIATRMDSVEDILSRTTCPQEKLKCPGSSKKKSDKETDKPKE